MASFFDTIDLTGADDTADTRFSSDQGHGQTIDLCASQGSYHSPSERAVLSSLALHPSAFLGVPIFALSDAGESSAGPSTPAVSAPPTAAELADAVWPSAFCDPNIDEVVAHLIAMDFDPEDALRAATRCSTVDGAVKYLLQAAAAEAEERPTFSCPVCMDEYDISEMITLSCLHRMCLDCFAGYCSSKIADGEVLPSQLCCPTILDDGSNKSCATPITIHEIKAYVPNDIFEKYDRFSTRAFCEDEQMRCCPKCNEWYVDLSDVLNIATLWCRVRCGNCHHPFCGKCGQAPHKSQPDQDISCEAMAAWLEANSKGDESLATYMKDNKLFPCPKCHMAAELSSGCKFLYCRCKATFCALCGKSLTQKDHYAHFQGAPGCTGPFGNVCQGDGSARGAPVAAVAVVAAPSNPAPIAAALLPRVEFAMGAYDPPIHAVRGRKKRKR